MDEFQKALAEMQRQAKELEGRREVTFEELFPPSFMIEHTNFSSFEELLEAGGFEVNSAEDFEAIPDDVFDQHIGKHTQFDSWENMQDSAVQEYAAKKLGF
ncbi:hypothetical protein [Paenibacillus humicus]|uniref:hypothetical protein n=1 Tax=Paenibacillus humicus TaxID=412861 RepID=UPI001FE244A8|nr:hypothetical protein [Paenibacillus humicus]